MEPGPGFEGIVGRSDGLRYVLAKVQQVAPSTTTVLLQGETGVGKERRGASARTSGTA